MKEGRNEGGKEWNGGRRMMVTPLQPGTISITFGLAANSHIRILAHWHIDTTFDQSFILGQLFYTLFLALYSIGIRVASVGNPKARKWLVGRKNVFGRLKEAVSPAGRPRIWMHCASLGEFEQGRPLLEELKIKYPSSFIVLSFFSPSGYEVMKDYKGADHVCYLPMDSPVNAQRFIDIVNPSLVLWVKYEYWFYYLSELKKRKIPVLLVSGIFRKNQPFFAWYGAIWRKMLSCFDHLFVQNAESKELLADTGIKENVSLSGDTRFDRVIKIASQFEEVPYIKDFCRSAPVLVAGSTWYDDEVELLHYVKVHPEIQFIIAPHEIAADRLENIRNEFANTVFYSSLLNGAAPEGHVLVIDNIGMLSRLYRYATVTFVGGGFGADGIHNVLEAAVYGKPVVFGPVYEKYDEAVGLVASGGGLVATGPLKLEALLQGLFSDPVQLQQAGEASRKFVQQGAGASAAIITYIQEKRLLTS